MNLTEIWINDPIGSNSEENSLTIADIFSSGVNIEKYAELKINSEKLYKIIEEEFTDRKCE